MRTYFLLFFMVVFLTTLTVAQGNISVNIDPTLEEMMNTYARLNKERVFIDGYRIQLIATTDRQKVEQEKQRFMELHSGITVDWTHTPPYYRLRAGAYPNRLEAQRMLMVLKRDYPSAYLAKDNKIRPIELKY